MPVESTASAYLSDLISGPVPFTHADNNFYTVRIPVFADGQDELIQIGTPIVWQNTAGSGNYVPYEDQSMLPIVGDPTLPTGIQAAIVVGPEKGAGLFDNEGITVTNGTAQNFVVLFRGPMVVKKSGMDYATRSVTPTDQAEFELILEKAGVAFKDAATEATPSFADYS